MKGGDTGLQQLFRFALPFRQGRPRTLDVGARPGVVAIQEEGPGPDVDGLLVARAEVVVEADQQELLDLRVSILDVVFGPGSRVGRVSAIAAMGL